MLSAVALQVLSGISRGMVLFIVASGLTLIFGVLRVANFAHGSFYMLAAFVSYSIAVLVGDRDVAFVAALIAAPLAIAAIGAAIEVAFLRPIARRPHHDQLILTYALTLIAADSVKMIWGRDYRTVARPSLLDGSVSVLGLPFPTYSLMLIVVGLMIAALLGLFLTRTRLGKTLQAAVADSEMVAALGVNVPLLYTCVFALGAGLAGLGGALAAPVGSISLGIDASIIIESFAVVIIGGVGSVGGALVGAMLIGIMHAVGILFAPKLAIAFTFVALCLVLLLRPQGLLGRGV